MELLRQSAYAHETAVNSMRPNINSKLLLITGENCTECSQHFKCSCYVNLACRSMRSLILQRRARYKKRCLPYFSKEPFSIILCFDENQENFELVTLTNHMYTANCRREPATYMSDCIWRTAVRVFSPTGLGICSSTSQLEVRIVVVTLTRW
jgi:hypothetical protein